MRDECVQKFWANVDRRGPDECWEWRGSVYRRGYGVLHVEGKALLARRVSFELAFGELPKYHRLRSTCRNPKCVNPVHLTAGNTEGIADSFDAWAEAVLGVSV